ncbi:hypothetical protein [Mariniblastus fucicola]|uniref:Uncharacterized protein n=1 Tax=Mariniblastus fucicola TaxID=980251 RepID=A0A5B9P684_9BACT|nr:hypothetical protein [Mariniblastus fucicola]QEG21838.1 hypothetical protein MFFC18_16980 [Mariniblastus fucicola]
MSLKFGIYLVEQRIVTPEQFCGLVKIQQESTRSLASLSIAQNYMTMKQVSRVLDAVEQDEEKFIDYATQKGLLERSDANHLSKMQEQSGESIRSLAVECGLLTARQAEVLFNHFQRYGSRSIHMKRRPVSERASRPSPSVGTPKAPTKPQPIIQPKSTPSPKFKQHPIIKVEEAQKVQR